MGKQWKGKEGILDTTVSHPLHRLERNLVSRALHHQTCEAKSGKGENVGPGHVQAGPILIFAHPFLLVLQLIICRSPNSKTGFKVDE